jgi:hypothetical protein
LLQEKAVSRQDWRTKTVLVKVLGRITVEYPHQGTIAVSMLAGLILGEVICSDQWCIPNPMKDVNAIVFTESKAILRLIIIH